MPACSVVFRLFASEVFRFPTLPDSGGTKIESCDRMCYMSDDPVLEYKIVEVLFEDEDSVPHLVEFQLRRLLEVCDEIDGYPDVLGSFPPCEPNFLNLPHFRCDVDCARWLTFRLFCLHELSVFLLSVISILSHADG